MFRILAYHRIAELADALAIDPRSVSATPEGFAAQMRHLARYYRVVSMPEVLDALERRTPLPKRSVLITFDDAYADFADTAWPILGRLRLPATLFVPTAYPGNPSRCFWWDGLYQAFLNTSRTNLSGTPLGSLSLRTAGERRRSLRALQNYVTTLPHAEAMRLVNDLCSQLGSATNHGDSVLTWDQLRQLADEGLTLGSHTRTHPILTQLPPAEVRQEISGSQKDLEQEIGSTLPIFCYPNGDHNDLVTNILREEGFSLAFTTLPTRNDLNATDLLRLGRIVITPRTSLPIFCLRLLRLGASIDAWRHRGRAVRHSQAVLHDHASLF